MATGRSNPHALVEIVGTTRRVRVEEAQGDAWERLGQRVAAQVLPATPFYAAEEYHQDYYKKNPVRYNFYRFNCGRDQRLTEIWGAGGHGPQR